MNFETFCKIINKHLFKEQKKDLLGRIADHPERFVGLFRPTKPIAKITQHILQSQEIRMGDALEEITQKFLENSGFRVLSKILHNKETGEKLSLDQFFTDEKNLYLVEQKMRDDHDSTKKKGQIENFKAKIKLLINEHEGENLIGFLYFIDPNLKKNERFYQQELIDFTKEYNIQLKLLYGKEFWEELKYPEVWNCLLKWLNDWKKELSDFPKINFDENPHESFKEIKHLKPHKWKKILENQTLWEEGLIQVLFQTGETLKKLESFFESHSDERYKNLAILLSNKIETYYAI